MINERAALAAFHIRMPVAHIEAGLRTHSTLSPFPEELNRQLIARVAQFHLAPTSINEENLVLEGVRYEQIFVTGNTGIDALTWASELNVRYGLPELADLEHDEQRKVVVVTAHRRENWHGGLHRIGKAIARLADLHPRGPVRAAAAPQPARRPGTATTPWSRARTSPSCPPSRTRRSPGCCAAPTW